jgi:hypothetical protein
VNWYNTSIRFENEPGVRHELSHLTEVEPLPGE